MESQKTLVFLDPDLYSATAGEDLESHFICVICCGVVLEPVECRDCQSLYCKVCLSTPDMPCPKKCGSTQYTKVNRFIINVLNKAKFKCQYKKCTETIAYENYLQHFQNCPEGKAEDCTNPECQNTVQNLTDQINQLKAQLHEIEIYKERNIQILKNQIQELKNQAKPGQGQQQVYASSQTEQALLAQIAKLQNDLLIASKLGVQSKMNSILCLNGHMLKQKFQHPFGNEVHCDICLKGNLLTMPFYFRCDEVNCNYDVCAFCYHLMVTDQKQLIDSIKHMAQQTAQAAKQPPSQEIQHNIKDLGKSMKKTFGSIFKKQ